MLNAPWLQMDKRKAQIIMVKCVERPTRKIERMMSALGQAQVLAGIQNLHNLSFKLNIVEESIPEEC